MSLFSVSSKARRLARPVRLSCIACRDSMRDADMAWRPNIARTAITHPRMIACVTSSVRQLRCMSHCDWETRVLSGKWAR